MGRGLKLYDRGTRVPATEGVAPYGAWIETIFGMMCTNPVHGVAPYGAWIETHPLLEDLGLIRESPRMGRGLKHVKYY